MHRYECQLSTKDHLITLDVYSKKELTFDEVKEQAINSAAQAWKQLSSDPLTEEIVFISYKYLGYS